MSHDRGTDGCRERVEQVLDLARRLVALADDGEVACPDENCLVLYGIVRDSAYSIHTAAAARRLELPAPLDVPGSDGPPADPGNGYRLKQP